MPCVAHLSPEKRRESWGEEEEEEEEEVVEEEEEKRGMMGISSTTRSLPPIHLEDISAQIHCWLTQPRWLLVSLCVYVCVFICAYLCVYAYVGVC